VLLADPEGLVMSMMCWVMGLSSTQIGKLRATPKLASDLALVAQDGQMRARLDYAIKQMPPERREAFETRMRASLDATTAGREAQTQIGEARARLAGLGSLEQALDLEKSWHILHYLMTGHIDDSDAPGNALVTGEPIGDDVGYGPARLHDEDATRSFGQFLATLDVTQLLRV
jgi:hypothetical protein